MTFNHKRTYSVYFLYSSNSLEIVIKYLFIIFVAFLSLADFYSTINLIPKIIQFVKITLLKKC